MDEKIDFVIPWVDGSNLNRQIQRNKYAGENPEDCAECRYRDWDNLKYFFRGIEKFTPWFNNVFFITCEQYPPWLNFNHPKLKLIRHTDYIPKEYLPTFNSHTIELNLHRIKDLSEHFVYFNDDMFIIDNMKKSDFFQLGLPKQVAGIEAIANEKEIYGHILLNDIQLINRHFSHKEVINKNKKKRFYLGYGLKVLIKTVFLYNYSCFVGFNNTHLPNPLLKSTLDTLWNIEYDMLDNSSKTKFRTEKDVNQYVFSRYDIASGNFIPQNIGLGHRFTIKNNNISELINSINKQKYKMICINDSEEDFEFEKVKMEIIKAFEKILPKKSEFEK